MKTLAFDSFKRLIYLFALIVVACGALHAKPEDKLTPAEVIAKHLDSIGPAEVRTRSNGTRAKGTCILTVRQGGSGQDSGDVLLGSQGPLNVMILSFTGSNTTSWMKFDGQESSVSHFRPGSRTALESFFAAHETITKEGLLGGTLSASWPLLNFDEKRAKIEYSGIKKIEGKQLHALKYFPRSNSDLKITLYFEAETFRHVRTQYERTIYSQEQRRIAGGGGTLPSISGQRATAARILAHEEFSDFKPEGPLNLPHTYKFELSIQSEVRPALLDWVITLTDFAFNVPLDPKSVG